MERRVNYQRCVQLSLRKEMRAFSDCRVLRESELPRQPSLQTHRRGNLVGETNTKLASVVAALFIRGVLSRDGWEGATEWTRIRAGRPSA